MNATQLVEVTRQPLPLRGYVHSETGVFKDGFQPLLKNERLNNARWINVSDNEYNFSQFRKALIAINVMI